MIIETKIQGTTTYKVANGTYYDIEAPDVAVLALENARISGVRVTFDYGNLQTGVSWGEVNDITGRIGRSMGPVKSPILLYNKRSMGGGCIITSRILSIKESKGGRVLYVHKVPAAT
jgi:hypothetical protein